MDLLLYLLVGNRSPIPRARGGKLNAAVEASRAALPARWSTFAGANATEVKWHRLLG
jgi:hypothetical protein